MNNNRRKQIKSIADRVAALQVEIDTLRDEEEEAYDNMPESLQDGERGEASQAAVDALDCALGSIEELKDNLEEAAQ